MLFPIGAGAADPVSQTFSHTVYMQPFSKLRQRAEEGDAQSQYDLAYLYYKSGSDPEITGVTRSDRLAAQWYLAAARQGHASAQYNMAVLHLHGHGVERDAIEAYAWLMQSSANGNENSNSLMLELDELLNAKQIDEARIRSAELPVARPKADFAQED